MTDQLARRVVMSDPLDPDETRELVALARDAVLAGSQGHGALAALARHLPLSLVRISAERQVTEVFGSGFEHRGVTPELFLGPIDSWGPDAVAAAEQAMAGDTARFDIEVEVAGTRFLYRVVLFPAGDGGAVAVAIDLTDQLSAHDAAAEQAELVRASIHALETAIVVQDADGRVLSHNPALAALLGADPDPTGDVGVGAPEILGRRPEEFLAGVTHENGTPFEVDQFPGRLALRTGEAQRNVTMRVTRQDGEVRLLQVSSFPIRLSGRSVVLTSLADVTHRSVTRSILRDSDDRFRLLADAAPIGIFVAAPDGTTLYVNPQGEVNAGRTAEEIQTLDWHEFVHPDDRRGLAIAQEQGLAETDGFIAEYRLLRPDGSTPWVRSRGKRILGEDGETIGIVGTIADITEVREAADRLREREERTRAILESAAEGIVGCLESGIIIEFNASAERIFGYDSAEVLGRMNVLDLLADSDRDLLASHLRAYLAGAPARITGQGPREVVGRHQDGSEVPIELTVTEVQTSEGRLFTGVIRDLSQQRAFEIELEHRATHDPVTGLPNRILFNVQLDAALARARKHRSAVAVLSVMVDRVSLVTASLGHEAADQLLIEAATRITKAVEGSSAPARVAHDQFVVILDEVDAGTAVEVAGRIIEAIDQPFLLGEDEALATAHVGIALSARGAAEANELMADAGVAMRRAAETGPVDYEIFDPDMRARVDARRRDEIAIRHGLERDEFELHYQPIFDLTSGAVLGAEALIRWHRPGDALVLPAAFIPLAEECGLIVELGAWVVRRACEQVAEWQRQLGPACPAVSINLSGRQLAHPDLIDTIRRAIIGTGADPAKLAFEITETVLLDDVDRAVATLESLHDLGVRLSLDDFGTGYSSLTYLCRFPVDVVKVDRSFVSEGRNINEPIVNMILGLARTLGLDVVAEGVETELQAETLRLVGCPAAQGFLFARPGPAAELTARLAGPR